MADILSKIILKAQGGDQAAREIRKVKEAYDEAGKSAKGLSAVTGAAQQSPFERALAPTGAAAGEGTLTTRRAEHEAEQEKARRRLQDHKVQTSSLGRLVEGSTRSLSTGVTSLAQGNITGAMTGGVGAAGSLLSSAASPYVAAAIATIGAAGTLGKQEYSRIQQTWQSGVAQQLGQTYTTTRNQIIAAGRTGVPLQNVSSMMAALAASGGRITPQMPSMMNTMTQWGISPQAMGSVMSTMQRLGFQGGVSDRTLGTLAGAFGYGRTGLALGSIQQLIESQLARGVNRNAGLEAYGTLGYATRLAQYQAAGFSLQGATALQQQLNQTYGGASKLRTPLDAITFRALRKPGESTFETMLRMEKNPEKTQQTEYELLKERYGGNLDAVKMVLMRGRGLTAAQAEAYVAVREGTAPAPPVVEAPPESKFAKETTATLQMQAFSNAGKAVLQLTNRIKNLLDSLGGGKSKRPTDEEASKLLQDQVDAAVKSYNQLKGLSTQTETTNWLLKNTNDMLRDMKNNGSAAVSDEGEEAQ